MAVLSPLTRSRHTRVREGGLYFRIPCKYRVELRRGLAGLKQPKRTAAVLQHRSGCGRPGDSGRASSLVDSAIMSSKCVGGHFAHEWGITHAARNNLTHHFGDSAYRGAARLAICRRLGSGTGRYPWRHFGRCFDSRPLGQDLKQRASELVSYPIIDPRSRPIRPVAGVSGFCQRPSDRATGQSAPSASLGNGCCRNRLCVPFGVDHGIHTGADLAFLLCPGHRFRLQNEVAERLRDSVSSVVSESKSMTVSLWSGNLRLSLVLIPVKMHSTVSTKDAI
jgi:hypothetical protein